MDIDRFNASLTAASPPAGLSPLLEALWYEGHGDWQSAHRIVQGQKSKQAAAVHAYLHRKEGDLSNADHWYERAQSKRPGNALETEWRTLVERFLAAPDK